MHFKNRFNIFENTAIFQIIDFSLSKMHSPYLTSIYVLLLLINSYFCELYSGIHDFFFFLK